MIPVSSTGKLDSDIYRKYDLCITGAALSRLENNPTVKELLTHTWVYARVSPGQKVILCSHIIE